VIRALRTIAAVIAALAICCSRPRPDLSLTLLQTAWPGQKSVEVVVGAQKLELTARVGNQVVDRRAVPISPQESEKLRELFWRAWRNQPISQNVPRLMDGILVEQLWDGPERSWRVSTRGPLTKYESAAFEYLNSHLPPVYRFPLELGFEHHKR
jgi:hypothetical protein